MSRYGKITGSRKISEDYQNINLALDNIEADVDAKAAVVTSHVNNTDIHVTAAQKQAWDAKADGSTATELADHIADETVHVTEADHDKLDGIEPGAQVNQPAFARVNDIEAADPQSQFYIVGGLGITVTTNPTTGQVTVTATGDAAPGEHGITHTEFGADPIPTATKDEGGLMSAAQAAELIAHGELLQQHNTAITSLSDRLDTADTSPVTLQPGLQVIHAAKDARFKLGQIEGKTEINYEGRIGLIGVENPYVIATSGNLLPPFYESWYTSPNATITIISEYELIMTTTGTAQEFVHLPSYPVLKNTTYTFSAEHNAGLNIHAPGIGTIASNVREGSVTFNTGEATTINVGFVDGGTSGGVAGTYTIKNPMLTIGSEPQPFAPQRKSMLAFQTELHANPTDSSEPDVLFEQNGEYRKLAKWRKVVLDGSWDWVLHQNLVGYKTVKVNHGQIAGFTGNGARHKYVTKYNGSLIPWVTAATAAADEFWNDTTYEGGTFLIKVSNTDSGWGDDYTPTQDEIRAYFMGWKMQPYSGARVDPYNGTGEKAWYPISRIQDTYDASYQVRANVPTSDANNKDTYAPYQLLYRLAKETVEPVVTEGSLLLSEGDNMVEVGTGIVLRERANPYTWPTNGLTYINSGNASDNNPWESTRLKYKVDKIKAIFKNDKFDKYNWEVLTGNGYGNEYLRSIARTYDPTAAYSVTYIKLDKSPIQSITGTLAANEKAQISDLTAGVTEALQRVSVVEQKKAEKDTPVPIISYITPTLLNNWANYGAQAKAGYGKDATGTIWFKGLLKGGVISNVPADGTIFILPTGYRPAEELSFAVRSGVSGTGVVIIDGSGRVRAYAGDNTMFSLNGVQFPVEV